MNKGNLEEYILENLDNALEQGHIKLFYQPILRALTREVCAMEGLARWIDPKLGIISPGDFVPVLEREHLVYKLDSFLIERMCIEYNKAYKYKEVLLPVSLNFSRHDFEDVDIYKVLDENVKKYRVPRNMMNIEITESTAGKSEKFIQAQIDKLHEYGYEVWMDDFGSEYSTLNLLKDFEFDLIKIDMRFMEVDNLKARQIIRFMVDMLKTIGIKTLAEGVETKEQFDFLCEIGCDKLQGYYIGKPMPGEDIKEYIRSRGYECEKTSNLKYLDDIARLNILSQTPVHDLINAKKKRVDATDHIESLAIIEVNDSKLDFKYYNKKFLSEIQTVGIRNIDVLKSLLADKESEFRKKIRFMLDTVNDVDEDCIIDHLYNGNFCVIRIFKIASEGKRVAYATKFTNISNNSELVRQYNRNKDIGQLYKMFSHVDLFDLEENSLTNIYTTVHGNYNKGKLSLELEKFCNVYVYPVDREKYMEFYNTQTMISRIQNARENIIRCYYRIKVEGQGYQWVMAVLSGTDNRKKHRILSCFRLINAEELAKIPLDNMISDVVATSGETFSDASLWQNFVSNTDVGMFWKDRDRRFVGVNKAFLDYYGFKSQDNVLGKNDEDMGWHIDPDKFKNDEEDILNKGIQTHGVLGTCINDGTVRNIVASKMPYYKNGRIEGIIGYFHEEGDRTLGKDVDEYSDDITDALNMKGLLDTVQQFVDSYIMNRNDFNIIYIDIVDFRHFINANGQRLAERVLQEVGKKIKEIIGLTGVLARIGGDHFVVLRSAVNLEEDEKLIDEIREEIYNIRRVDHVPCTVYLNIESERFSEARNLENLVIHLMNKSVRADK